MNLVYVDVVRIKEPPRQLEDGSWKSVVVTDCWGILKDRTVTGSEGHVKKYEAGFSWQE